MKSVFSSKDIIPSDEELSKALGNTFHWWRELSDFTAAMFPGAKKGWHFSGEKYGWSFRISDKKRVLIYLLPRQGFFKVAFVFGQKATDAILKSNISEKIKRDLSGTKIYAEGRGIRIEVKDVSIVPDIKDLIKIKISS